MLLEKKVGQVVTNLIGNELRVKITRESFKAMVGGIYSRPINAIIRELACNAFDSHVAANIPNKPFLVHLPNIIEPYFEIQDFGISMTKEEFSEHYETIYNSSKDNSNDFVGMFGIGRLSPMAYTDNFLVTVIKDKEKRVYSMYISESGNPSCALMNECFTDEGDGVAVRISVSQNDFAAFKDAADEILFFFETKPIIEGQQVEFEDSRFEFEGDLTVGKFKARKLASYRRSGFVMGNVCYPHDFDMGIDLIISVPIGTFEVAMPREEIISNAKNKETEIAIIQDFKKKFVSLVSAEFQNAKNYAEAAIILRKLRSYYYRISDFSSIKWNNCSVNNIIYLDKIEQCDYLKDIFPKYDFVDARILVTENRKQTKLTGRIVLDESIKFVIKDVNDFKWRRVIKKVKDTEYYANVYFIEKFPVEFLKELGINNFVNASAYELSPIVRNRVSENFMILKNGYFDKYTSSDEPEGVLVKLGDYRNNCSFLGKFQYLVKQLYDIPVNVFACYSNKYDKLLAKYTKLVDMDTYKNGLLQKDLDYQAELEELEKNNYNFDDHSIILKLDLDKELKKAQKKYQKLYDKNYSKIGFYGKTIPKKTIELGHLYKTVSLFDRYTNYTEEEKQTIKEMVNCYNSSKMWG